MAHVRVPRPGQATDSQSSGALSAFGHRGVARCHAHLTRCAVHEDACGVRIAVCGVWTRLRLFLSKVNEVVHPLAASTWLSHQLSRGNSRARTRLRCH